VLGNQALVVTLLFGQFCKRVFFGRLRDAEVEALYDKAWYAITETCLAMTIFREEFNSRFVALFTALLFFKVFHWLLQDRVAYMEQSPAVSVLTHGRILLLMATLFTVDGAFLHHAVGTSLRRGPSVLLLFGFEYLILASTVCASFTKYALHVNDMRLGGRWDDKGVYVFYLELVTDLFHMLVYLAFFILICAYPFLPAARGRLCALPADHVQHARALPGGDRGGARPDRPYLHYLPRAHRLGQEARMRPHLSLPLPTLLARTPADLPHLPRAHRGPR
jgi:E3 ubiquitin-protein ligase synoviolin